MIIQFGDWRLVPVDALNFELCHRHETTRGKNAGAVQWHRLGRFYSYGTLANALWYAATVELGERNDAAVMDIRSALREYERICNDLTRDVQEAVRNLSEPHRATQTTNHE